MKWKQIRHSFNLCSHKKKKKTANYFLTFSPINKNFIISTKSTLLRQEKRIYKHRNDLKLINTFNALVCHRNCHVHNSEMENVFLIKCVAGHLADTDMRQSQETFHHRLSLSRMTKSSPLIDFHRLSVKNVPPLVSCVVDTPFLPKFLF